MSTAYGKAIAPIRMPILRSCRQLRPSPKSQAVIRGSQLPKNNMAGIAKKQTRVVVEFYFAGLGSVHRPNLPDNCGLVGSILGLRTA